jgi:cytochrome d ubiquinol oxidase subunit I
MISATVTLSRILFSFTIGFHILFPVLTIGLSAFLLLLEAIWLKSRNEIYYRHFRFWSRLFLLNFAVGIVTGVVMEFQFGTNWASFSHFAGGFFGNILGFEAAIAFAAEAAFLALMMFGWGRISSRIHFFSTVMVSFMAVVSAFWIMDANSWMQSPTGVIVQNGRLRVIDYGAAIFNPFYMVSFLHKILACLQIALLVVGGISAWYLLKVRHVEFFFRSFKIAFFASIIVAPLQIINGDSMARIVYAFQPEKGAAMEARWETNKSGEGASWSILAWPDPENERNSFSISIPYMLSILADRSLHGKVAGLKNFPPLDRPPIILPFYSFRIMTGLAFLFLLLAVLTLIALRKDNSAKMIIRHKKLLRLWVISIPLGYAAMEFGWIVREVGRQPWSIYHIMRTETGISNVTPGMVWFSLVLFIAIYSLLFVFFIKFFLKIISEGPDFKSPLPVLSREQLLHPEDSVNER